MNRIETAALTLAVVLCIIILLIGGALLGESHFASDCDHYGKHVTDNGTVYVCEVQK